jgi:ribose transport system permease protein
MTRLLGVLLIVGLLYSVLLASDEKARTWDNQRYLSERLGFYGVLTLGAGVLIIAGGIDLSLGSVVGLSAVLFGLLLERGYPPVLSAAVVVALGSAIGLIHGLLVTRLRLQPFLVTLCGLFIYRGVARWLSPRAVGVEFRPSPILSPLDKLLQYLPAPRPEPEAFQQQVESLRWCLFNGDLLHWLAEKLHGLLGKLFGIDLAFLHHVVGLPNQFLLLLALTVVLALLMHGMVLGRYLFAIGANEQAARYAGIATDRYKILAYVICSTLAGLGGVLFLLDNRTATPTTAGVWLELYAITGAVLGGCSLRGGEGNVIGMFLGAAVLPLLRQLCTFNNISDELEYAVIGAALLLGTISDELLKRRSERRG